MYFPQFEAAVKQGDTGALMCSYNKVNGAYACENHHTLQDVLEGDWGFKGIVLSDYGASKDTAGDMNNGLDFVPAEGETDFAYQPQLIQLALATGQVSRATLDAHVRRIVRTLFAYGVFDRPGYVNDDSQINAAADQHTAEQVEERAITLLKNQGVLPLRRGIRKIAVIGPYANRFVTGGGSGQVTPRQLVTALEGITARAGRGATVSYADGSDPAAAAALARSSDVAVVVVGDVETEGQDKSCIDLNCSSDLANADGQAFAGGKLCQPPACPPNGTDEDGLISAVAAAQRKTVVVLETGAPVLTPWRAQVPAIVEAWYPGRRAAPRWRACSSATSIPAVACPPRSRTAHPSCRRRATRSSTPASPRRRTTARACSPDTSGTTPTVSTPRSHSGTDCRTARSVTGRCT